MPYLATKDTVKIANIAGSCIEDYCAIAERLSESEIDMFELNISCPNVKQGGVAFGTSCENAAHVVKEVRKYAKKPMIVKLSPNVTDIASIAQAVEAAQGGAEVGDVIPSAVSPSLGLHPHGVHRLAVLHVAGVHIAGRPEVLAGIVHPPFR